MVTISIHRSWHGRGRGQCCLNMLSQKTDPWSLSRGRPTIYKHVFSRRSSFDFNAVDQHFNVALLLKGLGGRSLLNLFVSAFCPPLAHVVCLGFLFYVSQTKQTPTISHVLNIPPLKPHVEKDSQCRPAEVKDHRTTLLCGLSELKNISVKVAVWGLTVDGRSLPSAPSVQSSPRFVRLPHFL